MNPSYPLDVNGFLRCSQLGVGDVPSTSSPYLADMVYSGMTAGSSRYIGLGRTSGDEAQMYYTFQGSGASSNSFNFGFSGVAGIMTLLQSGNIGIANGNPQYKLDVNGSINTNSTLTASTVSATTVSSTNVSVSGTTTTTKLQCGYISVGDYNVNQSAYTQDIFLY